MANMHRLFVLVIALVPAACGGGGSATPTSATPTSPTPTTSTNPTTPPAPPAVTMRVSVSRPASAGAATARPADITIGSLQLRFRTDISIELTATGSGATVSGSCTPSSGITIEPSTPLTIRSTQIEIGASSTMTIRAGGTLTLRGALVDIASTTVGSLDCRVTGTSTGGGIAVSASQTIDIPGSVLAANTAGCVTDGTTLCAFNRFQIQANAVHSSGQTSAGAVPSSSSRFNDGGYLWFFNDRNTELMVQILNRCSSANRYWVFTSGPTSMEIGITVTDTQTGLSRRYVNPQGQPFRPVTDTDAFATCP